MVKGVLPKTLARNVNANVSEREEEKVKEGPRLKRPTNKSDLCEAQANIDQPFI